MLLYPQQERQSDAVELSFNSCARAFFLFCLACNTSICTLDILLLEYSNIYKCKAQNPELLLECTPACPEKHSIWHAGELLTFGLDCFLVCVFSLLWVKSLSTSSPICADSLALPPYNQQRVIGCIEALTLCRDG